ncbi:hypothetical protein F5884DRAFT_328782 [Xylogone sp. PMI_703]|nr:hypothetical protein F5884DRAFT_328782 [Xylogone sp. PMI_703]
MRFDLSTLLVASLLSSVATSVAVPASDNDDLIARDSDVLLQERDVLFGDVSDLWKRKGGGGGGGRGGGGGSSGGGSSSGGSSSGGSGGGSSSGGSSSSGSGRGSSSGSSSSGSSGSGGRAPLGSTTSSTGGRTKTGSGPPPSFGGGRYYPGGAAVPYTAGGRTPSGLGPAGFFGLGALAFFPGLWLFGAWSYPYHNPYTFRNHTATNSTNTTNGDRDVVPRQDSNDQGVLQTKNVVCLCAQYAECGCDDSANSTVVLDELIGNGSYEALNKTLVNVADVNGTSTIIINGTLPNGTTAAGGSENANAAAGLTTLLQASGWWMMIASVGLTVFWV